MFAALTPRAERERCCACTNANTDERGTKSILIPTHQHEGGIYDEVGTVRISVKVK